MSKHKSNKNASFFHDRANELRELHKSLEAQFIGKFVFLEPLQAAAKDLDMIADGEKTETEWVCRITNLIIPLGDVRNIEPNGIEAKICINCTFKTTVSAWNNANCDPFSSYSFRVKVYGDHHGIKYSWGMHIDKESSTDVEEWHPLYHLHCFESSPDDSTILIHNEKKKGTFKLNVPRLVHYPLDMMLGIGFCLVNFYKKDAFSTFCNSGSHFIRLYKKSQDRILKPYFESLAGAPFCVYEMKKLCPQIV